MARIRQSRLPDLIAQFGDVATPDPAGFTKAAITGLNVASKFDKMKAAKLELEKAKLEMAAKKERERAAKEQEAKKKELIKLGNLPKGSQIETSPAKPTGVFSQPDDVEIKSALLGLPKGVEGPSQQIQVPATKPQEEIIPAETADVDVRRKKLAEGLLSTDKLAERTLEDVDPEERAFKNLTELITSQVQGGQRTIEEGADLIRSLKPSLKPFTDAEGRKGLVDPTDPKQKIFFNEETPFGKGGKITIDQFTPREQEAVKTAREQFNKSEFVKKQGTVLKEIDKIQSLVNANPQGAIGPTRTQVSKVIAGEIGRLTDQDIQRNIPTPDIWEGVKQTIKKFKDGNFTDVTIERYNILIKAVQSKMADILDKELTNIVDDVVKRQTKNANPDAVKQMVGRGMVAFIEQFKTPPGGESDDEISAIDAELAKIDAQLKGAQ